MQKIVARNSRVLIPRLQFSLLNGCDLNIVEMEELRKTLRCTSEAIAVPLKEGLRRKWRVRRTRIWVDAGAKEEDEEEEAAEDDEDATN